MLRTPVSTLQVNITRRCNLACRHCHVGSSPKRSEEMQPETAQRVLEVLETNPGIHTLDLTGGAPELNENFRSLVEGARRLGREVIDRCNLTVLFEEGQEDTATFMADQGVRVVASLPCYSKKNVEKQRGLKVFDKSIEALRLLNQLGYAKKKPHDALTLDLVYNPGGAFLPPDQGQLEDDYRKELRELFDIEFSNLLTLANLPIDRFAQDLERNGELEGYLQLLEDNFNPQTTQGLMCRSMLSVSYDGTLHDCDFNQMLEIPLGGKKRTLWDLDDLSSLTDRSVATANHCFGCTAGAGSSCAGSLADPLLVVGD
ncbi:MAG: arsenosugar biosynthesis radical SAM protein ArsS [Deltaproteobacteria bacterium]|nr:arsenosugar biosynthesis radical SAM protein ArsS [Deltaproteobacteria bacterium]